MKQPLRLVIHVPLREERDYRQTLVGMKHALRVDLDKSLCTYDLLPQVRPRKGQEHQILEYLADQLGQGLTLMVWDTDLLLQDLEEIFRQTSTRNPKIVKAVQAAWNSISAADDEQLIDLRSFIKFPGGHYLDLVVSRETARVSPKTLRVMRRSRQPNLPRSEEIWGVLHPLILSNTQAAEAWKAFLNWRNRNRPRMPQQDIA